MGPKYEHFKFAIGDFVQLKQLAEMSVVSRKMMVVGHRYDECPGGVQLHAVCRNMGYQTACVYLELELEPWVETNEEAVAKTDWSEMAERKKARAALRSEFKAGDPPPTPPMPGSR